MDKDRIKKCDYCEEVVDKKDREHCCWWLTCEHFPEHDCVFGNENCAGKGICPRYPLKEGELLIGKDFDINVPTITNSSIIL